MDNLVLCNMTDEEKRNYNFDLLCKITLDIIKILV